jgi:hypothetical protein
MAVCDLCREKLIMKLGDRRAHHYSHRPGGNCILHNPETAAHHNTKHLLASKLRDTDMLSVVTKCAWIASHVRCASELTYMAAEGWEEVCVEQFIDPVRPDILLLSAGVAALAIEVRATHTVSDTKAARLANLNIPWIEVVAGDECDNWEPGTSLPAIRHESKAAPKYCTTHSQPAPPDPGSSRAGMERGVCTSTTQSDLHSHGERWRFRVVDCYPDQGPRVRKVFWVYSREVNSHITRLRLATDHDSPVVTEVRTMNVRAESLRYLNECLREHLKQTFVHYDSPKTWQDLTKYPDNPAMVYRGFMPVKYRRNARGEWTAAI